MYENYIGDILGIDTPLELLTRRLNALDKMERLIEYTMYEDVVNLYLLNLKGKKIYLSEPFPSTNPSLKKKIDGLLATCKRDTTRFTGDTDHSLCEKYYKFKDLFYHTVIQYEKGEKWRDFFFIATSCLARHYEQPAHEILKWGFKDPINPKMLKLTYVEPYIEECLKETYVNPYDPILCLLGRYDIFTHYRLPTTNENIIALHNFLFSVPIPICKYFPIFNSKKDWIIDEYGYANFCDLFSLVFNDLPRFIKFHLPNYINTCVVNENWLIVFTPTFEIYIIDPSRLEEGKVYDIDQTGLRYQLTIKDIGGFNGGLILEDDFIIEFTTNSKCKEFILLYNKNWTVLLDLRIIFTNLEESCEENFLLDLDSGPFDEAFIYKTETRPLMKKVKVNNLSSDIFGINKALNAYCIVMDEAQNEDQLTGNADITFNKETFLGTFIYRENDWKEVLIVLLFQGVMIYINPIRKKYYIAFTPPSLPTDIVMINTSFYDVLAVRSPYILNKKDPRQKQMTKVFLLDLQDGIFCISNTFELEDKYIVDILRDNISENWHSKHNYFFLNMELLHYKQSIYLNYILYDKKEEIILSNKLSFLKMKAFKNKQFLIGVTNTGTKICIIPLIHKIPLMSGIYR